MSAVDRLRSVIAASGPVGFDELVEVGLYDPDHGFYATTGRAGRRGGDFITSPEVGPLFGAVLANALDARWVALGRPAQFRVAEAAAGRGTLARSIRHAAPDCLEALDYVLVDVSEPQREMHADLGLPFRSEAALPEHADVILANELLDNLAFRVARLETTVGEPVGERRSGSWSEVLVDVIDASSAPFSEMAVHLNLGALVPGIASALSAVAQQVTESGVTGEPVEVPIAVDAADWVTQACERAGLVLVIDYGATTAELAARPDRGWMRTYQGNQRGASPLRDLGGQDITIDVPLDQLPPPTRQWSQRDFLIHHGVEVLVEEGRRIWEERAAIGDLEAIRARSRIVESEALLDPAGLGAFVVLEWERGQSSGPD